MTTTLQGTVALVTGASSGIGEATARLLASDGVAVALVARRKDRLETLATEIAEAGGRAIALDIDITEAEGAIAAVERTVAELGRLDTLVNNAGVMLLGPALDAPLAEWEQMVELNVLALLRVSHAALPHLVTAAGDGTRQVADIVNISSTAGRAPRLGSGVYNLTKFGIGAFSESLRQEITSRFVRVSLVEPGMTATELRSHVRPDVLAQMSGRLADVTALEAADIADAVHYIVTRRRDVAVNEMLIRPTTQSS